MLNPTLPKDTQLHQSDRGRWQIPVPRRLAQNLHHKLEKIGYASTLCLCPQSEEAWLELWPEVDPQAALRALLDGAAGPPGSAMLTASAGLN
jgi:hypothetical protein